MKSSLTGTSHHLFEGGKIKSLSLALDIFLGGLCLIYKLLYIFGGQYNNCIQRSYLLRKTMYYSTTHKFVNKYPRSEWDCIQILSGSLSHYEPQENPGCNTGVSREKQAGIQR